MYQILLIVLGLAITGGNLSAQELRLPNDSTQVLPSQGSFTEVQVKGSTAFSESDFAPAIAPYLNQEITAEALLQLGQQLTELYQNAGYPTSEVVLLEQEIVGGRVVYQAIEGRLTELEIQGLRYLRKSYIRERIELACIIHERRKKLKKAEICLQILVLLKLDKTKSKINQNQPQKSHYLLLKKLF